MPAGAFRTACAEQNIRVGRDFPPYEEEWARISISTIDDMRRAVDVFGGVLADAGVIVTGRRSKSAA